MRIAGVSVSKRALFALLMGAAALTALLPPTWTSWTQNLIQPIAWLELLVGDAARRSAAAVEGLGGEPASPERVAELERLVDGLRRQVGQQSLMISELQAVAEELMQVRESIGNRGAIVLASVIGGDTSRQRETVRLSKGHLSAPVERGLWVLSGDDVSMGAIDGPRDVLLRQWIIGRVHSVAPFVCEVQLATDPQFGPEPVRAARPLPDGDWVLAPSECLLDGVGGGRMRIRDATENYHETGFRYVVTMLGGSTPFGFVIGEIVGATRKPDSPLHYDLEVAPISEVRRMSRVFVLNPSAEVASGG